MQCPNCGTPIGPGCEACGQCGFSFFNPLPPQGYQPPLPAAPKQQVSGVTYGLCALLCAIAMLPLSMVACGIAIGFFSDFFLIPLYADRFGLRVMMFVCLVHLVGTVLLSVWSMRRRHLVLSILALVVAIMAFLLAIVVTLTSWYTGF